jgi:hypothetical protein
MDIPSRLRSPLAVIAFLTALPSAATSALAQTPSREALLALHRQLLESVFLRGDTTVVAVTALPNLVVVPPGGIVENRAQLLNGVQNTLSDSLLVDEVMVADYGTTAVVVARVTMARRDRQTVGTGRSRMMSVFVHDGQQWRLLARSVTPCIERAVSSGRC